MQKPAHVQPEQSPPERTMENRKTRQVSEFELVDDHGMEYKVFEYQERAEKPSLKWIKARRFSLSDGTAVDRLDNDTFKIPMIDRILHRQA
jgi:hypothetical protein